MGDVLRWPLHVFFRCPPGQDRCVEGRCMVCEGGLTHCMVCGCAEGELPTDCPGERLEPRERAAIYAQYVDFRDGEWVRASNTEPCRRR